MKEPVWVLREVVHALHERLLSEFGGAAGVRDDGMLESALSRPANQFAYGNPTACRSWLRLMPSAWFAIIPFVDGNKRTGFATAALFLELNGYRFAASEIDATVQTLALGCPRLG